MQLTFFLPLFCICICLSLASAFELPARMARHSSWWGQTQQILHTQICRGQSHRESDMHAIHSDEEEEVAGERAEWTRKSNDVSHKTMFNSNWHFWCLAAPRTQCPAHTMQHQCYSLQRHMIWFRISSRAYKCYFWCNIFPENAHRHAGAGARAHQLPTNKIKTKYV